MKKRETFVHVGDGIRALEPGEMVGKNFRAEDGRIGKVVENSFLDITVEFNQSPTAICWGNVKLLWDTIKPLKPRK